MTPSRSVAAAIAVLLLGTFAGACAVGEQAPRAVDADAVPFGLLDPAAEPLVTGPPAEPSVALTACYLDAEGDVVPVAVPVEGAPTPEAALAALATLPADQETLTTAVPEEPTTAGVDVAAGVATVGLLAGFDDRVAPPDQLRFVAQVVCTLTGLPGIGQVAFTENGAPLAVPTGSGSLVTGAVSRDDYAELLATVTTA